MEVEIGEIVEALGVIGRALTVIMATGMSSLAVQVATLLTRKR